MTLKIHYGELKYVLVLVSKKRKQTNYSQSEQNVYTENTYIVSEYCEIQQNHGSKKKTNKDKAAVVTFVALKRFRSLVFVLVLVM